MVQTGGVIGKHTVYAVYWDPTGFSTSISAKYQTVINTFLTGVAHTSGKPTNIYATNQQYYTTFSGTTKHLRYTVAFGGPITLTTAFPANGCTPSGVYAAGTGGTTHCLTDGQEVNELKQYFANNPGAKKGLGAIYMVYFPPKVETCFTTTGTATTCSAGATAKVNTPAYCGYHSGFATGATTVLYANMPYPTTTAPCFTVTTTVNGTKNASAMVSITSHEQNETITDSSSQWRSATGNEDGDDCAYVYGAARGGTYTVGTGYNEVIDGHEYLTQLEFSDQNYKATGTKNGCIAQEHLPTASFTGALSAKQNVAEPFTASASSDPNNAGPLSYTWTWGDGTAKSTGVHPSHTFTTTGTHVVTLTVTDLDGWSATASKTVQAVGTTTTATKLAVTTPPSTMAGTTFTVTASIENATGAVLTTKTSTVTLAKKSGTGTLTCAGGTTKAAATGVATFSCSIGTAGTYVLTASSAGLTAATTGTFTITSATTPMKLATTTPTTTMQTKTFTVDVTVENGAGSKLATATTAVTLAIKPGTGAIGAKLSCTTDPVTATAGTAQFSCSIDKVGSYVLTASSGTLQSATTGTFSVTVTTTATQLAITTPGVAAAGTPGGKNVTVGNKFTVQASIDNASGTVVTTKTTTVHLALVAGTGTSGAALACTGGNTQAATTGVATFSCTLDKVGSGYQLTATAAGLTKATTKPFAVTKTVAPTKLVFSTQPPSTQAGSSFTAKVSVENATGVLATNVSTVTLAIASGTGTSGASLSCTGSTTQKASSGVATFTCSIDKAGTGYQLKATDGAVTATSTTFEVTASSSGTTRKTPGGSSATGYRMVASDGGIFAFGTAPFYGSEGGKPLNKPIVGIADNPNGKGYWEVASDGGIFAFGTAPFYGSMGGKPLNAPIVSMAATPDGKGYWLVASDGGLFGFGDATFYGSMGGKPLNKPIVGMAATPDGKGYWLVASDGGLFSFGDATFYGSMGGKPLNAPIVSMTANPNGKGYWEVASDGGIFAFGTAPFYGSMGGKPLNRPIVSMTATPDGKGYWMVASDGGLFSFGDATFSGSMGGKPLNAPIVGMAS